MKNLFLALAVVGLTASGANAQDKPSQFDQNYRICYSGSTYKPCTDDREAPVTQAQPQTVTPTTYVALGTPDRVKAKKSRMVVTYDDPNAPYQGEESMVNDGVDKNGTRNTNYTNTSADLPPSDGGLSQK